MNSTFTAIAIASYMFWMGGDSVFAAGSLLRSGDAPDALDASRKPSGSPRHVEFAGHVGIPTHVGMSTPVEGYPPMPKASSAKRKGHAAKVVGNSGKAMAPLSLVMPSSTTNRGKAQSFSMPGVPLATARQNQRSPRGAVGVKPVSGSAKTLSLLLMRDHDLDDNSSEQENAGDHAKSNDQMTFDDHAKPDDHDRLDGHAKSDEHDRLDGQRHANWNVPGALRSGSIGIDFDSIGVRFPPPPPSMSPPRDLLDKENEAINGESLPGKSDRKRKKLHSHGHPESRGASPRTPVTPRNRAHKIIHEREPVVNEPNTPTSMPRTPTSVNTSGRSPRSVPVTPMTVHMSIPSTPSSIPDTPNSVDPALFGEAPPQLTAEEQEYRDMFADHLFEWQPNDTEFDGQLERFWHDVTSDVVPGEYADVPVPPKVQLLDEINECKRVNDFDGMVELVLELLDSSTSLAVDDAFLVEAAVNGLLHQLWTKMEQRKVLIEQARQDELADQAHRQNQYSGQNQQSQQPDEEIFEDEGDLQVSTAGMMTFGELEAIRDSRVAANGNSLAAAGSGSGGNVQVGSTAVDNSVDEVPSSAGTTHSSRQRAFSRSSVGSSNDGHTSRRSASSTSDRELLPALASVSLDSSLTLGNSRSSGVTSRGSGHGASDLEQLVANDPAIEYISVCNKFIDVIETQALPKATENGAMAYFLKIQGDLYRFTVPLVLSSRELLDQAIRSSAGKYMAARESAAVDLAPTHPIRLTICQSFSYLVSDVAGDIFGAYNTIRYGLDEMKWELMQPNHRPLLYVETKGIAFQLYQQLFNLGSRLGFNNDINEWLIVSSRL